MLDEIIKAGLANRDKIVVIAQTDEWEDGPRILMLDDKGNEWVELGQDLVTLQNVFDAAAKNAEQLRPLLNYARLKKHWHE